MRRDYHMHPKAWADEERFDAFVSEALRKDIKEICVTDHMPLSISNASDRIIKGRVGDYCRRVRELSEKYSDRMVIKCGIEIDYHPTVIGEIEEVLAAGEFDYVLGSSHMHLFTKNFSAYTRNGFAELALENAVKAVETGWFNTVSHPDMYRVTFTDSERFPLKDDGYDVHKHEALIKELIEKVAERGMRMEINPHLAEKSGDLFYVYPQAEIVEWALERGVKFTYGSDAHKPSSVGALLPELEAHPVYGKAIKQWEDEK